MQSHRRIEVYPGFSWSLVRIQTEVLIIGSGEMDIGVVKINRIYLLSSVQFGLF